MLLQYTLSIPLCVCFDRFNDTREPVFSETCDIHIHFFPCVQWCHLIVEYYDDAKGSPMGPDVPVGCRTETGRVVGAVEIECLDFAYLAIPEVSWDNYEDMAIHDDLG